MIFFFAFHDINIKYIIRSPALTISFIEEENFKSNLKYRGFLPPEHKLGAGSTGSLLHLRVKCSTGIMGYNEDFKI